MIHPITLPKSHHFALRENTQGGHIEARRVYPFDRHFVLVKKDGFRYASKLTEECVANLVQRKLIEVTKGNPSKLDSSAGDSARYDVTELGIKASRGEARYDDGQLDLLDLIPEAAA